MSKAVGPEVPAHLADLGLQVLDLLDVRGARGDDRTLVCRNAVRKGPPPRQRRARAGLGPDGEHPREAETTPAARFR